MKTFKWNKFLVITSLLFAGAACTSDFEEINTNPNGPVVLPSSLLLPSILEATADRLYDNFLNGDQGETWIQHWGKVQYNEEERYSPRATTLNNTWNGLYVEGLSDARAMYELAEVEGNEANMGVALVMQSYIFSLLTEMFGAIPYEQALMADEGNTTPAYNTQQEVYNFVIADIDEALTLLSGEGSISSSSDLMYGGDASKWAKFANSLKFRLLMRMESGGETVASQLQAIAASGLHFQSNTDNAELPYTGVNPNANPIWNNIVFTNRLEWRVNQTTVELLKDLGDPRLGVYAQEVNGEYRGVAPGINNPVQSGYGFDNTSMIGEYFLAPDLPAIFMSYSELMFLMAEAAQRGLISTGTAQEYYNNGVIASFNTYNGFVNEDGSVISINPQAYLAAGGAYPAAGSAADQLAAIRTQNYIALYSQGVEAWTEWRRTKTPALSPAIDPIGINQIPSRYLYPSDEQTLNTANYNAAAEAIGGDEMTTDLWFMN